MPEREKGPNWRKSSFSGVGDCLEWATMPDGVWLRDSKNRMGPHLELTLSEWSAFLAGVKDGEADLPMTDRR